MNWHTFINRAHDCMTAYFGRVNNQQHAEHMVTATKFILATERKAGIGHQTYVDNFVSQIYLMGWTHSIDWVHITIFYFYSC
jgi:hypothetical protein